ncbi:MAG: hypothetical protein QNI90_04500 [Dinoroseobacter sp.]|nr:hypothetical protein [Dinoroseobacter sp.]MDJ0992810.1 hypothetical protein [Dinoroseobacter sp.]
MSYGNVEASLEAQQQPRTSAMKFSWQRGAKSASGPQPEVPTDYIVHKMRSTLRPEIGVAPQELRAIRFIEVFLFLVFFPLGFALNRYNKVFGPSLAMSVMLFSAWWGVVLSLIYHL